MQEGREGGETTFGIGICFWKKSSAELEQRREKKKNKRVRRRNFNVGNTLSDRAEKGKRGKKKKGLVNLTTRRCRRRTIL